MVLPLVHTAKEVPVLAVGVDDVGDRRRLGHHRKGLLAHRHLRPGPKVLSLLQLGRRLGVLAHALGRLGRNPVLLLEVDVLRAMHA